MSIAVFIIDTSYLLEMFRVPGLSNTNDVLKIRKRYEEAENNKCRFIVPVPCIFELGNHISRIKDGNKRKELAKSVYDSVKSSIEQNNPWNITPSIGLKELPQFFKVFEEKYVSQKISLTDSIVIQEAIRLKKKYKKYDYPVHIWTKDNDLKAYEPDREENPFLG